MAFDRRETAILLIGDFFILVASLWMTLLIRNLSFPPFSYFEANVLPFVPMFLLSLAIFSPAPPPCPRAQPSDGPLRLAHLVRLRLRLRLLGSCGRWRLGRQPHACGHGGVGPKDGPLPHRLVQRREHDEGIGLGLALGLGLGQG